MANIFTRLISSFKPRPTGVPGMLLGQTAIYPQANNLTFIDAYVNNATVYTIVSLMARKFAFIPRYVYAVDSEDTDATQKRESKIARKAYNQQIRFKNPNLSAVKMRKLINKAYEDQADESNPLQMLISQPNPMQGQDSYYQTIYTYKKLTGNAYVWLNRGDFDDVEGPARLDLEVFAMYPLPSQYVTLVADRTQFPAAIVGYQFWGSGGTPIYIPKEDIIHWKDPNPIFDSFNLDQLYGLSPLYPGLKLIAQDESARDAAVAMFQNGGARGVLYNSSFDNLTEKQVKAADAAINTKINNKAMKSAIVQLPGQWGYLFTGQSAVDMELLEAQDKTFQRICNLLGCNPQLFETQTTFNNVEQARKDLITNAILPDCASFKDEENRILLQAFGYTNTQYCIDIDVTDLPELQDDMKMLTDRTISNWTLSVNEKREELGFDPIPGPEGDIRFIPTLLTTMEDAAVPASSLTNDGSSFQDNGDSGNQVQDLPSGQSGGSKARLSAREGHEKGSPGQLYDEARALLSN